MIKRLILICVLFIVAFAVLPVAAQDDADEDMRDCSPAALRDEVDLLAGDFSLNAAGMTDVDSGLQLLAELEADINGLYTACTEQIAAERAEELTAVLDMLYEGGYVIYVRHTETDRSQGDTDLSSCETQRNLNEAGRQQARDINMAFIMIDFPVGQLISTQYCRTLETAQLAFGEPEIIDRNALGPVLEDLLSTAPEAGTNTLIVAHIGTLDGFTRISPNVDVAFAEGDSLIFAPLGDDYELVGRIALGDWPLLAVLSAAE